MAATDPDSQDTNATLGMNATGSAVLDEEDSLLGGTRNSYSSFGRHGDGLLSSYYVLHSDSGNSVLIRSIYSARSIDS